MSGSSCTFTDDAHPAVPVAKLAVADRPPAGDPEPAIDSETPARLAASVRPYVLPGRRTHPGAGLGLEKLVSTRPYLAAVAPPAGREHRAVVELRVHPRSRAEVAALLRLPLGVARVLIGGLSEVSALAVHHGTEPHDTPPSGIVLHRVLEGLRRL